MRCGACRLPLNSIAERQRLYCDPCHAYLQGPSRKEITADLKRRQARRRDLQKQLLPEVLRKHAANRAEIAKKILTFVGFDLPGE